jgi:hypothetical protein
MDSRQRRARGTLNRCANCCLAPAGRSLSWREARPLSSARYRLRGPPHHRSKLPRSHSAPKHTHTHTPINAPANQLVRFSLALTLNSSSTTLLAHAHALALAHAQDCLRTQLKFDIVLVRVDRVVLAAAACCGCGSRARRAPPRVLPLSGGGGARRWPYCCCCSSSRFRRGLPSAGRRRSRLHFRRLEVGARTIAHSHTALLDMNRGPCVCACACVLACVWGQTMAVVAAAAAVGWCRRGRRFVLVRICVCVLCRIIRLF